MEKNAIPIEIQEYIKNFEEKNKVSISVEAKNSSKLMKIIGWIFKATKISPEFMTRYYTTIGNTIYIPEESITSQNSESLMRVIVHESIHIFDSKRFTSPLFKFLYLFPQSLSLFSLMSIFAFLNVKFLFFLLFLLSLAPFPAPFRYWFELRAYRTSIIFAKEKDNLKQEEIEPIYKWIIDQLSTKFYYFTWPFPTKIYKHLKDESFMQDNEYKEIINWIKVKNFLSKVKENKNV